MKNAVCRIVISIAWGHCYHRKSRTFTRLKKQSSNRKKISSRSLSPPPARSTCRSFWRNEAGYFSKRGVTVNLSTLSATASAQALLSGTSGHLPGRHGDDSRQRGGLGSDLHRRQRRSQHADPLRSKRLDDFRQLARQVGGDDFGRRLRRNRYAQNRQRARHGRSAKTSSSSTTKAHPTRCRLFLVGNADGLDRDTAADGNGAQ